MSTHYLSFRGQISRIKIVCLNKSTIYLSINLSHTLYNTCVYIYITYYKLFWKFLRENLKGSIFSSGGRISFWTLSSCVTCDNGLERIDIIWERQVNIFSRKKKKRKHFYICNIYSKSLVLKIQEHLTHANIINELMLKHAFVKSDFQTSRYTFPVSCI